MLTLLVGILGSCAFHGGYMSNSASLSQNNFRYVGEQISGSARTTLVFGFGNGLSRTALVDEAKRNMLLNNPLQSNQALANITVNFDNKNYLLLQQNVTTVTADIVEFDE